MAYFPITLVEEDIMTSSAQDRCYRWRSRFGDRFADYRISPLQHGQCECRPYAHFQYF